MTTEIETNVDIKLKNSELPIKQLLALSRSLDEHNYHKTYHFHKTHSVFLNPVPPPGTHAVSNFFDHAGLVRLYEQYTTPDHFKHEQGYDMYVGVIAQLESGLRQMYQRNEQMFQREGKPVNSRPENPSPRTIAEHCARLSIAIEEAAKMKKIIAEREAAESEKKEAKRVSAKNGNVKRSGGDGVISSVDGMAVKNGIITDINQPVEEYLNEVKAEKERRRAARIAPQEESLNV